MLEYLQIGQAVAENGTHRKYILFKVIYNNYYILKGIGFMCGIGMSNEIYREFVAVFVEIIVKPEFRS